MQETTDHTALAPLPGWMKLLKWLVIVMAVVMIVGFMLLIMLLMQRLDSYNITLPEDVQVPGEAPVQSFTQGESWFAVTTEDSMIYVYDRQSGALINSLKLLPESN